MNKNGKFITANEAVVTPKQHTSPCSDCPFRRDAIPGWLGQMTAEEWYMLAHGEGSADCHTTKQPDGSGWQCAGLAVYRANVCKSVRDPNALRLKADTVKVFSFGGFMKHHTGEGVNVAIMAGGAAGKVEAATVPQRTDANVARGIRRTRGKHAAKAGRVRTNQGRGSKR